MGYIFSFAFFIFFRPIIASLRQLSNQIYLCWELKSFCPKFVFYAKPWLYFVPNMTTSRLHLVWKRQWYIGFQSIKMTQDKKGLRFFFYLKNIVSVLKSRFLFFNPMLFAWYRAFVMRKWRDIGKHIWSPCQTGLISGIAFVFIVTNLFILLWNDFSKVVH